MENLTMKNWNLTIVTTDGISETTVAYNADLTEAQVRAYETAMAELKPGDGVTYGIGSDRYAGTVLKRTPATITITMDRARNTATFPDQRREFATNPDGAQRVFTRRKDGRFRERGSDCGILHAGRDHYMDPHF